MKQEPFPTAVWVILTVIFFVLFVAIVASAQDQRTLVHTQPLHCGGYMEYHDTNATPQDGAEIILLFKDGEREPRARVEFDVGEKGAFKQARVTIPGLPIKTYTDHDDVPDPCEIVSAVGAERT